MLVPKTDVVLGRAVEESVSYGLRRSRKHTDEPTDKQIEDSITTAVLDHIYEYFYSVETKDTTP
jgi:hypothetical protein